MIELVAAAFLAFAAPAPAALPAAGSLSPGHDLGGVSLGQTPAAVRSHWGTGYRICTVCTRTTWLYTYRGRREVTGTAVSFARGHVTAVYTLGAPLGWHTSEGLTMRDPSDRVLDIYDGLSWSSCAGYGALSMRKGLVVTSIYTYGESVYGFALTRPSEPVCQ